MFSKFFYTLKEKGLEVSLGEWLDLQEALDKGLCELADTVLLCGEDDTGEERDRV